MIKLYGPEYGVWEIQWNKKKFREAKEKIPEGREYKIKVNQMTLVFDIYDR